MITADTGMRHSEMLNSRTYGKAATACFVIILAVVIPSQAKEWRGIVPLHSTRADVERLLGPPSTDRSETTFYELDREEVSFHYAKGSCGVESSGWNVPRDTVTSIWIIPKPNLLKLTDLKLDESKFKKERDKEVQYIVSYINEVEGISYQVDVSAGSMITLIEYFPAAKDAHLRCPASSDDLEGTTKLYSYSDIPFESEKKRLDSFAEQIRRYSSTQAYIMVYAGRRARAGEARIRAVRAKEYLVKNRGIEAGRLTTINGGHREELTVELYLVPPAARPPLSTPTVNPKEVHTKPDSVSNNRCSPRPRRKRRSRVLQS